MERTAKAVLRRLLPQLPPDVVEAATLRDGALVLPTVSFEIAAASIVIKGLCVRLQASLRPSISIDAVEFATELCLGGQDASSTAAVSSNAHAQNRNIPEISAGASAAIGPGLQRLERASAGVARLLASLAQTSSAKIASLTVRVLISVRGHRCVDIVGNCRDLQVSATNGLVQLTVQFFELKVIAPAAAEAGSAECDCIASFALAGTASAAAGPLTSTSSSSPTPSAADLKRSGAPALRLEWLPFSSEVSGTAAAAGGRARDSGAGVRLHVGHASVAACLPQLLCAYRRFTEASSAAVTPRSSGVGSDDGPVAALALYTPHAPLESAAPTSGAAHSEEYLVSHCDASVSTESAASAAVAAVEKVGAAVVPLPSAPTESGPSTFSPRGLWRFLDDRIRGAVAALAAQPADWASPDTTAGDSAESAEPIVTAVTRDGVGASEHSSATGVSLAGKSVALSAASFQPSDSASSSPPVSLVLDTADLRIESLEVKLSGGAASPASVSLFLGRISADADVSGLAAGRIRCAADATEISVHAESADASSSGHHGALTRSFPPILRISDAKISFDTAERQGGLVAGDVDSQVARSADITAERLLLHASPDHLSVISKLMSCLSHEISGDSLRNQVDGLSVIPAAVMLRMERPRVCLRKGSSVLAAACLPEPADTLYVLILRPVAEPHEPAGATVITCGTVDLLLTDPLTEAAAGSTPSYPLLQLAARGDALGAAAKELSSKVNLGEATVDATAPATYRTGLIGVAASELRLTIPSPAHAIAAVKTVEAFQRATAPMIAAFPTMPEPPLPKAAALVEDAAGHDTAAVAAAVPTPVTMLLGSAAVDVGLAAPHGLSASRAALGHSSFSLPFVEALRLEMINGRLILRDISYDKGALRTSDVAAQPSIVVGARCIRLLARGHRSVSSSQPIFELGPSRPASTHIGASGGSSSLALAESDGTIDSGAVVLVRSADVFTGTAAQLAFRLGHASVRLHSGLARALLPPIFCTIAAIEPSLTSLTSCLSSATHVPASSASSKAALGHKVLGEDAHVASATETRLLCLGIDRLTVHFDSSHSAVTSASSALETMPERAPASLFAHAEQLQVCAAVSTIQAARVHSAPESAHVLHASVGRLAIGSGGLLQLRPAGSSAVQVEQSQVAGLVDAHESGRGACGIEVKHLAAATVALSGNGPSFWLAVPSVSVVVDAEGAPALIGGVSRLKEEAACATRMLADSESRSLSEAATRTAGIAPGLERSSARAAGMPSASVDTHLAESAVAAKLDRHAHVGAELPPRPADVAVPHYPDTARLTPSSRLQPRPLGAFTGLGVASFSLAPKQLALVSLQRGPHEPLLLPSESADSTQSLVGQAAVATAPLPSATRLAFVAPDLPKSGISLIATGKVAQSSVADHPSPDSASPPASPASERVPVSATPASPVSVDWRLLCAGDEALVFAIEALQQDVNASAPALSVASLSGHASAGSRSPGEAHVRAKCTREAAACLGTVRVILRLPSRATAASESTSANAGVGFGPGTDTGTGASTSAGAGASVTAVDAVAHGVAVSLVEVEQTAGVAVTACGSASGAVYSSGPEKNPLAGTGFEHVVLAGPLKEVKSAVPSLHTSAVAPHEQQHVAVLPLFDATGTKPERSFRQPEAEALVRLHARVEVAGAEARITDPDDAAAVGALSRADDVASAGAAEGAQGNSGSDRSPAAWMQLELQPGAPAPSRAWLHAALSPLQLSASPALVNFLQALPDHPAIKAVTAAAGLAVADGVKKGHDHADHGGSRAELTHRTPKPTPTNSATSSSGSASAASFSASSSSSFVEISSRDGPAVVFKQLVLEPWSLSLSLADRPSSATDAAAASTSTATSASAAVPSPVYLSIGGVAIPLIAFKRVQVGFPPVRLRDVTGTQEAGAAVARLYAAHTLSRLTSLASALPSTVMPDVTGHLREHAARLGAGVSSLASAARAALVAASASLQTAAAAAVAAVSPLAGVAGSTAVGTSLASAPKATTAAAAALSRKGGSDAAAFSYPEGGSDSGKVSSVPAASVAHSDAAVSPGAAHAISAHTAVPTPWDNAAVTTAVTSLLGPRLGAMPAQILSSVHSAIATAAADAPAAVVASSQAAAANAASSAPSRRLVTAMSPQAQAAAASSAVPVARDPLDRRHHDVKDAEAEDDDDWQLL